METLKPQFTPGHSITTPTPITSVEEKISNMQMQQELENRIQLIKDLSEKLESLKMRRQEDKEKLKDYDKLKIQVNKNCLGISKNNSNNHLNTSIVFCLI